MKLPDEVDAEPGDNKDDAGTGSIPGILQEGRLRCYVVNRSGNAYDPDQGAQRLPKSSQNGLVPGVFCEERPPVQTR